jgi:hypothetical protein
MHTQIARLLIDVTVSAHLMLRKECCKWRIILTQYLVEFIALLLVHRVPSFQFA